MGRTIETISGSTRERTRATAAGKVPARGRNGAAERRGERKSVSICSARIILHYRYFRLPASSPRRRITETMSPSRRRRRRRKNALLARELSQKRARVYKSTFSITLRERCAILFFFFFSSSRTSSSFFLPLFARVPRIIYYSRIYVMERAKIGCRRG